MRAESEVLEAPTAGFNAAPTGYLRAVVAVSRSARPKEFVVVHFGSGTLFRTDRLGALAVRALIYGRSDIEAVDVVDRIEPGAGERARRLIDRLAATGAVTRVPLIQLGGRRRRRLLSLTMSMVLNVLAPVVRLAPTPVLVSMFRIAPNSPIGHHVWRSQRSTILDNLRASGYADRPESWLLKVGRGCAAWAPLNGFFMYLGVSIPPGRLGRVVDRLFDHDSVDELAGRLQAAGPMIGVFLHSGLCVAVPNALRIRGQQVVRTVVGWTHGINLSDSSSPVSDFFGDSPEMTVDVTNPLATGALIRHLKAGRSVYIALDKLAFERRTADVDMLGHRFPRNDGPAWLAVRSGRPLALWNTYRSPAGVVIRAYPLLYPDPSLPAERRVAALSEQLYMHAESAIRDRPEAWACWSYLGRLKGNRR